MAGAQYGCRCAVRTDVAALFNATPSPETEVVVDLRQAAVVIYAHVEPFSDARPRIDAARLCQAQSGRMSQSSAVFRATVDASGILRVDRQVKATMAAFARSLKNSAVEIVLRKKRVRRSSQANRYYWGAVIAEIASCAGYRKADAYQLHDALAFKFLPLPNCPITGSPRRMRTPDTDTAEFSAYLEQVIQWAAETWGVVIPEAHQVEPPESTEPRSPRQVDREHGWGVAA